MNEITFTTHVKLDENEAVNVEQNKTVLDLFQQQPQG